MIPFVEVDSSFAAINQQTQTLVAQLGKLIASLKTSTQLDACPQLYNNGLDRQYLYIIDDGLLTLSYGDKSLATLESGDIILPDIAYQQQAEQHIDYRSEAPVHISAYPVTSVMQAIASEKKATALWTKLLLSHQAILTRLFAATVEEEPDTTPGFEYFTPGQAIIEQGARADYVFSIFEGHAKVVVDDTEVGHVNEGEVIGALALLTNSPRSATVIAETRCSVIKVPKAQFSSLIRSNPDMIHTLLTDMARQIIELNRQVVKLT